MKRLNFDILDKNHDITAYERRRNSSPDISTSCLSHDHVVRHPRNTPSELCDFHSQSQGRCWYYRTALKHSPRRYGREWSASCAKENYWTLLEWEFDSGSTSHLFDTRDLTAWSQPYCDDKCTKKLYSVWILPVNYKRFMNRHARKIDPSPPHVDSWLARLS